MRHLIASLACAVAAVSAAPAVAQDVSLDAAFPNLSFDRPLLLRPAPDGGDRLVVVEQDGRVNVFENDRAVAQGDVFVALDITSKVRRRHNEEGLLGLAFSPDWARSHEVFLHYSASGPTRNVLSRWTMDPQTLRIDPDSERVILEVEQPWGNHNGGHIDFGPDGYLYVTLGDGGAGGDPHNNGQNKATLLGAILRIDVTDPQSGTYDIPPDNPFVNDPSAAPEIWAWGLRNVWRFSFDPETGLLWAGDVGQNKYEEIDIITRGGNYGWNIREGFHPFRRGAEGRKTPDLIDPVLEYDRQAGISVTGGYVYRGKAIPSLVGHYVFGDFGSGKVWSLVYDAEQQRVIRSGQIAHVDSPASFGQDKDGELYVCSFNGKIYKFVPGR